MQLVLSLFPGLGLLDMAFEREGFCVVQSRDWFTVTGACKMVWNGVPMSMGRAIAKAVREANQ